MTSARAPLTPRPRRTLWRQLACWAAKQAFRNVHHCPCLCLGVVWYIGLLGQRNNLGKLTSASDHNLF